MNNDRVTELLEDMLTELRAIREALEGDEDFDEGSAEDEEYDEDEDEEEE